MIDKLLFLPPPILSALKKLDGKKLYEIRIRADKPVRVCYGGKFCYLCDGGLSDAPSPLKCLKCTAAQIAEIIVRAAEFSIYAINNNICAGYITIAGGLRIGVAGELVYEGERVKTQKNFTSLVIRVPHEITNCASTAYASIMRSKNKNTLVISPPGCGKTTILRDLSRKISDGGFNTLLVDERGEIAACQNGTPQLDVGVNTDIITGAEKNYAFSFGIRSMRPDFIITDELASAEDISAVKRAALSGVNVIASLHAADENDIKTRNEFSKILTDKIFGRYIFLSSVPTVGTYAKILDQELNAV